MVQLTEGMGKIQTNIFETNYCRLYSVDNTVKKNYLGFRFFMMFNDRPTCQMIRPVISFGARKTDKKMLKFLEFPQSNTASALLV
jgi:hypothetical protein